MPMLDRRIVVRVSTEGVNQFGETETTTTDRSVWATLIQDKLARNIEVGGAYAEAGRVWRVRFDQRFVDAQSAGMLSIIRPGEDADIVTGIGEPAPRARPNRRRFLDLLTA